jgi:hypothetical protein
MGERTSKTPEKHLILFLFVFWSFGSSRIQHEGGFGVLAAFGPGESGSYLLYLQRFFTPIYEITLIFFNRIRHRGLNYIHD